MTSNCNEMVESILILMMNIPHYDVSILSVELNCIYSLLQKSTVR